MDPLRESMYGYFNFYDFDNIHGGGKTDDDFEIDDPLAFEFEEITYGAGAMDNISKLKNALDTIDL